MANPYETDFAPSVSPVSGANPYDADFGGPSAPASTGEYLKAAAKAGGRSLLSAGARLVEAITPTTSDEDIAVLYKDNPAALKEYLNSAAAGALSRFAREQSKRAEETMQSVGSPTGAVSGKPIGELEYATTDPEKAAYLSPTRIAGDVLQSLPSSVALMVAGFFTRGKATVAAQEATAAAVARGASVEEAKAAGQAAAIAQGAETMAQTSAVGEGAVGYGQQFDQSLAEALKVPPAVYQGAPEYQALLAQGYDPEVAHLKLANKVAREAAITAGGVDAVTNLMGGRILGKVIGEGGSLLPRTAKGFASEAGVEAVQSAGEQLGQNVAQQSIEPGKDAWDKVLENFVQGGIVGGVMGGATAGAFGGALHPSERRAIAETKLAEATNVDEIAAAATDLAGSVAEFQQAHNDFVAETLQSPTSVVETQQPVVPTQHYDESVLDPVNTAPAQRMAARVPGAQAQMPALLDSVRQRAAEERVNAPLEPRTGQATENPAASQRLEAAAAEAPPYSADFAPLPATPAEAEISRRARGTSAADRAFTADVQAGRITPEDVARTLPAQEPKSGEPLRPGSPIVRASERRGVAPEIAASLDAVEAERTDGAQIDVVHPDELPSAKDATLVGPENDIPLTREVHGALSAVAQALGQKLVVVKSDKLIADAWVDPAQPGTVFLNARATKPHLALFGHEFGHNLQKFAPQAYDALVKVVQNEIGPDGLAKHAADYGAHTTIDEVTSDLVGNRLLEPEFMQRVIQEIATTLTPKAATTTITRLGMTLNKVITKIKKTLLRQDAFAVDAMVKDLDKIRDAVRTAIVAYAKQRAAGTPTLSNAPKQASAGPSARDGGVQTVPKPPQRVAVDASPQDAVLGVSPGQQDREALRDEFGRFTARESARRAQTGTPEFKAWFGKSKLVDAAGNPLVMYHGTTADFNVFKPSEGGILGPGIYLTTDRTEAGLYTSKFRMEGGTTSEGGNVMPVYARIENPVPAPLRTRAELRGMSDVDEIAALVRMGYDGIITTLKSGEKVAVAFMPSQVKSAIGNSGSFDRANPDIRKSERRLPEVKPRFRAALEEGAKGLTDSEVAKLRGDTATKFVKTLSALPETDEMAAIAWAGRAKRGWYKGSAEAMVTVFGPDAPRFAALLAALSPQTSIELNLQNALNVWKNWTAAGRPQGAAGIRKIMGRSVQGHKGEKSVLGAWRNNVVSALTVEDPADTEFNLSGPKVNSFFQNLIGHANEVTNDTWMANYAMIEQDLFAGSKRLVHGKKIGDKGWGYLAMSAKVRMAAARLTELTGGTWSPAEVQETVWSWAKALYEAQKDGVSASELLYNEELTDELVNATPDFRTLFQGGTYAKILEASGLSAELASLRDERSGAAPVGRREGEKAPFDSSTQSAFENAAAQRLERLKAEGRPDRVYLASERRQPLTLEGVHYSQQPRTYLSSDSAGTGLKGAERERGATKDRINFYVDKGQGVQPEAGVGAYAHKATLANLYDMGADPDHLGHDSKGLNDFEKRVVDAGYAGYYNPDFTTKQGAAVLLGKNNIKVERAGEGALPPSGAVVPRAVRKDTGFRATIAKLEGLKSLPAGALTPARWGQTLKMAAPALHAEMADSGVFSSGTEPVYKNELVQRYKDTQIKASERRATLSDFTSENLPDLLTRKDWTILTAADPGARKQSEAENAKANAALEKDLADAGYEYTPVIGKYGDVQPGFIVTGIAEEKAKALGQKYGQESILTRDGLVYSDGRPNTPVDGTVTVYDKPPEDFYTEVPSTGAYFQVGLKFSERRLLAQVRTPEFKKWFDDSEVVDEEGAPLVVYHGTSSDFTRFSAKLRGASTDHPTANFGFFFTTNPKVAEDFAVLAKPFEPDDAGVGPNVMPVYLSIQNPYTLSFEEFVAHAGSSGRAVRAFAAELARGGFDGVHVRRSTSAEAPEFQSDSWVAFKPTQIKSAIGNSGAFSRTNPDIRKSERRSTFYSALQRQLESVSTAAAPAGGWQQQIKGLVNKGLVKQDEVTWSGVDEWLTLQGGKVSKGDLLAYLGANGVRVEETQLGAKPLDVYEKTPGRWYVRGAENYGYGDNREAAQALADREDIREAEGANPKFGQYTLPGGTNYREVLLTLPNTRSELILQRIAMEKRGALLQGNPNYTQDRAAYYALQDRIVAAANKEFKSGHWDQPNVLAHIRLNDRTDADGARVLFVEEIQSDWGQAGKKKGFGNAPYVPMVRPDERDNLISLMRKLTQDKFIAEGIDALKAKQIADRLSLSELETFSGKTEEYTDLLARESADMIGIDRNRNRAPAAPFVGKTEAWVSLALKRVIKMAVDEGYDRVAFINGEQSAERYDLSKQVSKLEWDMSPVDTVGLLRATGLNGEEVIKKAMKPDELADHVGKEVAQRLLDAPSAAGIKTIQGDGLKVGGTGMIAFYDKIVPNVAKEVLRKVGGGPVTTVKIENPAPKSRIIVEQVIGGWALFDDLTSKFYSGNGVWEEDLGDNTEIFSSKGDATVEVEKLTIAAGKSPWLSQPGFDITPTMIERAEGGMPLFSPRRNIYNAVVAPTWAMPQASTLDDVLYRLQDKHIDLKRVTQAIGAIADRFDPYLGETLYHGRSAKATQDFANNELKPLLVEMKARGIALPDLETYLHNRHAEERNVQIAKVNPNMPDGGSGIKTADARAYLRALTPVQQRGYAALAARVDKINAGTRALLVSSGLETQDTIDAWTKTYSKYVPLQRADMDLGQHGSGTGAGFSTRGSAAKRAMGSEREVVDILANLARQRETTITRAEKNRVSQALYALAVQRPNSDFWLAVNPEAELDPLSQNKLMSELIHLGMSPMDADGLMKEPVQRFIDPKTGLVTERINPALRGRDNVVAMRVDGKDRFVFMNQQDARAERLAEAFKNLDAKPLGEIMSVLGKASRWISSVNTQYNPIFGLINFIRDVQGAALNLSTTPIAGKQAEVMRQVLPALRGIYIDVRHTRAGTPSTSAWSQLWEEFQREGGQTGYKSVYASSKERSIAIADELKQMSEGKLKQSGRAVLDWLSDYNESIENSTRLAAYKVAKDSGMSPARAAELAKDITVNFNRKGKIATDAGALYAFFNAAVQGTERTVRTLAGPTGKKILYGGLLLGVLQALAIAAAGFDDGEPPDQVKERNFVFPLGDGTYATIPMPQGFNVIPGVSRLATEFALRGFKEPTKMLGGLGTLAASLNPMGGAGTLAQVLTPTALDPIVALAENKDAFGRPIAKQDRSGLKPTPGFTRKKDTATTPSTWLAEAINWVTGGTKYTPGMLSPTPDQIDFLAGQIGGGVVRELGKVEQTVASQITGEALPPYKVPVLGRFYGDTNTPSAVAAKFYLNAARLGEHELELAGRRKDHTGGIAEYIAANPEAVLVPMAKAVEQKVSELRTKKSKALEKGDTERVKMLEEMISIRQKSLNDRVKELAAK